MKIKRILCCLAFAACSALAQAQALPGAAPGAAPDPRSLSEAEIKEVTVPSVLYRLAASYKQAGDLDRLVWSLERLTELMPNTGELKLALASVYAAKGDSSKTYDVLLHMQRQGFGYDLADNPSFAKVKGTRAWDFIADSLKTNMKPFGQGKVAFSLPKGDYMFESLAYDPARKEFLAGSVREGKIYRVGKGGKLEDFISPGADNGLWSVYAMAADPDNDALYVASTSSVYFKGFKQEDYGKAGVFKFRLSSGKLLNKYLLADDGEPHTLSSIAVGRNGAVFAADGLRSIIYRLDGGTLKVMVENPRLTSVRGLAVSGDGKRLYFADYSLGVFGVDLAAGKAFDLGYAGDRLVLGGVDGLYWYDGALVVIENGMSPKRVMRLTLDKDGRSIEKAMPLDVANAAFTLPTYGTIDGTGLYFVANSQKNAYDAYGVPKDASKLEPVHVFRSDLRFAWNESGITTTVVPVQQAPAAPHAGAFGNVESGARSTQPAEAAPPSGR
jgi:sugar lactone lactonase YvrE